MVTTVASRNRRATPPSPLTAPWQGLLDRVHLFKPDVIILIARKVPRLAELLRLGFSPSALVISDMAIPFAVKLIRNRRVAIIDDLVNVGSTLVQTESMVKACGASACRNFALGSRRPIAAGLSVECYFSEPLSESQYAALVASVPDHLRRLSKPYDLEFPVIECQLAPGYGSMEALLSRLQDSYGPASVHDVSTQPNRPGLARVTVDLPADRDVNCKLRLYIDWTSLVCNVTPIAVPSDLALRPVPSSAITKMVLQGLEAALATEGSVGLWPEEPRSRVYLFSRSLDFGLCVLEHLRDVLVRRSAVFSLPDARLLFGLAIDDAMCAPVPQEPVTANVVEGSVTGYTPQCGSTSPFWDNVASRPAFLQEVRNRLSSAPDAVRVLNATFDVLHSMVGASDPCSYSVNWPYSRSEILHQPYLRLRIGPTFGDLVQIYEALQTDPDGRLPSRHIISGALDLIIDSGAAVPTLGRYGGRVYRIYRKGECPARDEALDRILFAWKVLKKPLSMTRAAKLNAILAFCSDLDDVTLPKAIERGNVATLQSTCIDPDTEEVIWYARNTGRLEEVSGDSSGE